MSTDDAYDAVGNSSSVSNTTNGQTEQFSYDHRDRLTRAWTTVCSPGCSNPAPYDESYSYNAIGNLTAKGPTGSLTTYSDNASGASSVRPHAVTAVGAQVYQYDNNGNMTSRTGKTITWHADNTVASVVGPDNIPEGYTYDTKAVTRCAAPACVY